jgi:hypothetical protein
MRPTPPPAPTTNANQRPIPSPPHSKAPPAARATTATAQPASHADPAGSTARSAAGRSAAGSHGAAASPARRPVLAPVSVDLARPGASPPRPAPRPPQPRPRPPRPCWGRRHGRDPARPTQRERNNALLNFTDEGDMASGPLPATPPAAGVTSALETEYYKWAATRMVRMGSLNRLRDQSRFQCPVPPAEPGALVRCFSEGVPLVSPMKAGWASSHGRLLVGGRDSGCGPSGGRVDQSSMTAEQARQGSDGLRPVNSGAPGRTRTCNLLFRRCLGSDAVPERNFLVVSDRKAKVISWRWRLVQYKASSGSGSDIRPRGITAYRMACG